MKWANGPSGHEHTQRANSPSVLNSLFPHAIAMIVAVAPILSAHAQETQRPSIARQKVAAQAPMDATVRVGRFGLQLDASLAMEYNSNINSTSIAPIGDLIVTPEMGIAAAWQFSSLNTLRFSSVIGYSKYINNPRYDRQSLTLSPDSALTFNIYVGDVRIEFHDSFALTSNTSNEASLSGVVSLPRFENTVGVALVLDLNQTILSLGYDHYNLMILGSAVSDDGSEIDNLNNLDHATEQLSASATFLIDATLRLGVEATAALSRYPDAASNDFDSFSAGPLLQYQFTRYTSVQASAGLKGYSTMDDESVSVSQITVQPDGSLVEESVVMPGREGGLSTGFYANVALSNRLNRYFSHNLSFGHEDQADAFSGRTETNFAAYRANWTYTNRISFGMNLALEDIKAAEGAGFGLANTSDYRRFGVGVTAVYALSGQTNIGLSYGFTKQESDNPGAAYDLNRVSVRLGYRF